MLKLSKQPNAEANWFGYKKVTPDAKTRLVEDVFASVAENYDLMNDIMSGGIHRLWKDSFIRMIRPRADQKLLDVAGGTGDIAFRYIKKAGDQANVTVCDLSPEMLEVGKRRALDQGIIKGVRWINGNAEDLPFEDMSFDVYTIAFGLRNVTHIDDALREAYRVLEPGGRFFCLEFSTVKNPLLSRIYDAWSFGAIPKIGKMIANDADSYQYLAESIRKFPDQEHLKKRLQDAGFERVSYRNLSGGIAAVHTGYKL